MKIDSNISQKSPTAQEFNCCNGRPQYNSTDACAYKHIKIIECEKERRRHTGRENTEKNKNKLVKTYFGMICVCVRKYSICSSMHVI